jgi:uncharacterized metal-binding protein
MPNLPRKKVGLIACGGEELAEGTLTRVAIRLVLEKHRPDDTVTLCLPLFLAGEKEERAFARFYPTIAIDGCGKDCARRATEKYSAPVAAAVRVDELLAGMGVAVDPAWRRSLDEAGWAAAERLAEAISAQVDALLGPRRGGAVLVPETDASTEAPRAGDAGPTSPAAPCACATQIPVSLIEVAGRQVEMIAVMAILDQFYQDGKRPGDAIGQELLEAVRLYNLVPDSDLAATQAALESEFARFCERRGQG